jgi:YD repeat-containing protein
LTIVPNGAGNRLTRWGGKTYSYDPNGNLLADGTHSYQWNERNELTGLSAGATSLASFSYDSLGRRSAKTVAGATTGFVYDGDTFVQELLGASSNSVSVSPSHLDEGTGLAAIAWARPPRRRQRTPPG